MGHVMCLRRASSFYSEVGRKQRGSGIHRLGQVAVVTGLVPRVPYYSGLHDSANCKCMLDSGIVCMYGIRPTHDDCLLAVVVLYLCTYV
jgi:hypothetical protein